MEHQINEEIRDKEVRLISDDGEQLGIVPIQQAQDIAVEKGMDLVKIAPQAKPPVCKIMDYGKFRFEQAKREKEARKNQRVVEIKEIRSASAAVRSPMRRSVRTCSIASRSCARNAARWKSSPSSKAVRCLCSWRPQKTSKPKSAFSAQIQRGANPYA